MANSQLTRFAGLCSELGNRASDNIGFVPVVRLAELLQADIEFHPLLVEALIAKPKAAGGRWLVAIDSDRHPVGKEAFLKEQATLPLSPRLRSTIAHELAHTLSFRTDEFGIRLELQKKETRADAIRRLEAETERLTPLLLVPQSHLEHLIVEDGIHVAPLVRQRDACVVSSLAFVARFALLERLPEFALRHHLQLTDVAIGLGQWVNHDSAILSEWPLFTSFSGGIVPEFLIKARRQSRPRLQDLFESPDFMLNGGSKPLAEAKVAAGTSSNPVSEEMAVSIEVESSAAKKSGSFLIVIRRS